MKESLLRECVREILLNEQADPDKKVSASVIFRRAVGLAIAEASRGDFEFNPPSGGPTSTSGIRVNPADKEIENPTESMESAIEKAGFSFESQVGAGLEGSKSGKFPTFKIVVPENWFNLENSFIKKAIEDADISDDRKKYLKTDIFATSTPGGKPKKPAIRITSFNIVLRAKSLESRLFTGQGQGELAEYAVAGAINGEDQFELAIEGAILRPSWEKSDEESKNRLRDLYDQMVEKTSRNMEKAGRDLFGTGARVEGGGGGRYDVVSDVAKIHVKYDKGGSMSRLAGIKPELADTNIKATQDAIEDQLAALKFGGSTHYWKYIREEFKQVMGIDPESNSRDKELLRTAEFYQWLLGLQTPFAFNIKNELVNITPEQISWLQKERPNMKELLIKDITDEFVTDVSAGESNYFYFTFYPDKAGNIKKLKIEQLGMQGTGDSGPNFDIIMNPKYLDKSQIGSPYLLVDADDPSAVYMELEFRNKVTSKPVQMHRGDSFTAEPSSGKKAMGSILVNEIRSTVKNILLEELTKKQVEKIAKDTARKEIIRVVGNDFAKSVQDEIKKALGEKATKKQVADISKEVLKKLYREMSHSYNPLIDRIKI